MSTQAPAKDSLLITLENLVESSERTERFWAESVGEFQDTDIKRFSIRYALVYIEENGIVTDIFEPISRELAETLTLPHNHKIILVMNLYESEFAEGRQELLAKIGKAGNHES